LWNPGNLQTMADRLVSEMNTPGWYAKTTQHYGPNTTSLVRG